MGIVRNLFFLRGYASTVIFISLFVLLGDVRVCLGDSVRGVEEKSVKIGLMADFTGPTAEGWLQIADGFKSFFRVVNHAGGIHGRKIDYVIEDDRYTIPLALSCFKKLVYKDRVFALQGASGTGHTAAIIPLVEREKLPLIAGSGENKFFVPARKYIFCPVPWYEDQAKLVVEYIFNDMKMKSPALAFMYPDTASGKQGRDAVRELVKTYPVRKYKEITFSLTAVDYTSQVLTLKRWNPDVIFLHGLVIDTSSIAKAAYRLGFIKPIIVNQYACSDEVLAIAGKTAKGMVAVNCFGIWDDDISGVNKLRKAALAYNPKVHRRSPYFFQGWLMAMLFYQGFSNAGRDLNTETFLNGMESIRNFDTEGICGVITFGPDDHKAIKNHRFYRADVEKKRFVPISGWREPKD